MALITVIFGVLSVLVFLGMLINLPNGMLSTLDLIASAICAGVAILSMMFEELARTPRGVERLLDERSAKPVAAESVPAPKQAIKPPKNTRRPPRIELTSDINDDRR